MRKYVNTIIANPLFTGSLLMILGNNFSNAINYIYHVLMGRILGPANYGELVALISLIGLVGMIPASLNLVVVKYISSAKNSDEVSSLANWFNKKAFLFSLIIFLVMSLFSFQISDFLKIPDVTLIVMCAVTLVFSLPSSFNRAILQGLIHFKEVVISMVAENGTKLLLGLLLVYLGFAVKGALFGLVFATLIGWFISRIYMKKYLSDTSVNPKDIKDIWSYSLPVILQSVALTSLISTDLVIVKHFFSNEETGIYGALSMLGKIIYFGAGPISAVMFPLISQKQALGQGYKKVFIYSIVLTATFSSGLVGLYWLFPELAIKVLFGSAYLEAASMLVYFGVFMSLFTLSSLLINFHLSLRQTGVVVFPVIAAVTQAVGIWFYHNSLIEVISISIWVTALLLLSLFVYFWYADKTFFSNNTSVQAGKNDSL